MLKRFFKSNKLSEMLSFREKKTREEKIANVIETYDKVFDKNCKYGLYEGEIKDKLKVASNLLDRRVVEDTVSKIVGISITENKKFKKKL